MVENDSWKILWNVTIQTDHAVMGISGSSRQCRRKCRPMWDLWREKKIAVIRFSMSVAFIFATYIMVDYF